MTASPRGGACGQFVTSNFYETRRARRGPTSREKVERGFSGFARKSILSCVDIIDFRVASRFSRRYKDSVKK